MSSENSSERIKAPHKHNTSQLNSLKTYSNQDESIEIIDQVGLSWDNDSLINLVIHVA